jgi:hypothetical protein
MPPPIAGQMNKRVDGEGALIPAARRRDWQGIHYSPLGFSACLFMVAITVYLASDDLSWRPRLRPSSGLH